MNLSLSDAKAAQRKAAYAARKQAHENAAMSAQAIRDHFLAGRLHTGAAVISGYRPIRTEIDPTPLMCALHAAGHRICVPVIEAADTPLAFREWHPDSVMKTGAFGAEIPESGAWLEPDLLLAPLLAFDAHGWRLGYGGGFYDRTLQGLRASKKVRAVGVAYSAQQVDRVCTEPTDQVLDAILTECGLAQTAGVAA